LPLLDGMVPALTAVAKTAASPVMRDMWRRDAGVLRAFQAVNADGASCGLGLTRAPSTWLRSGQSRLRTDIPLYGTEAPPTAYNRLLAFDAPLAKAQTPPGFRLQACYGPDGGCLYARPGACARGPATLQAQTPVEVRRALANLGYEAVR